MSVILGRLSGAFLLNCELFALTLLFALPLGLVVAFGSMSRCRLLSGAVKTFVWGIRGTPLMLQIIVIYLGPGLLGMNNPWPSGSGGRMVAAAALLSTLNTLLDFARERGLRHSVMQIQAAESAPLAGSLTLKPLNPVFLIGIFPGDAPDRRLP